MIWNQSTDGTPSSKTTWARSAGPRAPSASGCNAPARYLRLQLCYYGEQGTLEVASEQCLLDRIDLCRGWHRGVLKIEGATSGELLTFRVTPVVPVASDARELGIMLRRVEPFDEETSAQRASAAAKNLRRNQDEHRAGLAVLESTPPALRVNVEARCNIPETSQACA